MKRPTMNGEGLDTLLERGLYVDLPPWGFHVFAW